MDLDMSLEGNLLPNFVSPTTIKLMELWRQLAGGSQKL